MSKLYSYYSDNIDRAWYKSSNIIYSECIDNDNDLKTLKVVFNNGSEYQYEKVDVRDYLLFRESDSQGKTFNRLIKEKKYEYSKIGDADLDKINEEYVFRSGNGVTIKYDDGGILVTDTKDNILVNQRVPFNDEQVKVIAELLENIGYKVRC